MLKNDILLNMDRNGEFSVRWTDGHNTKQCGKLGESVMSYKVHVETSAEHLDKDGFIVDNNAIHEYFVQRYKHVQDFQSCELIAAKACDAFHKLYPALSRIWVSISGNPTAAWLTAQWPMPSREN